MPQRTNYSQNRSRSSSALFREKYALTEAEDRLWRLFTMAVRGDLEKQSPGEVEAFGLFFDDVMDVVRELYAGAPENGGSHD
jgi:hypothetical protein